MRRISSLLLNVSLVLAQQFFDFKLTSDASQRYLVNAQMATGANSQFFNFALTTSSPFTSVAGVGCSTCNGVSSYNQQNSTTVQSLPSTDALDLVGGVSTSGPLIREDCALHTRNNTPWPYKNQTIIMSSQSTDLYSGQTSGVFGLASGLSTSRSNVSIIGGCFTRRPALPSVTFGMALQPPSSKGSDNAGTLHWLGTDPSAYDGDITWKTTTSTNSNSDISFFDIDGWQFRTGRTTVTNSNQDLSSAVDPYYVNMFFPSQEAQLIHAAIEGSSSITAFNGQSTVYVVPCNSKFSLSTIIGGQTWQVDQALLVKKFDNGTCQSNIQGWTDANNKQYLFGSAFLSSLYVIIQVGNPNGSQGNQIGFAKRTVPPSIVGPIVGGVVGGVGGIALISLAIFFWIRRRDQQKLKDILDAEDRGGNVGRFVENKDVEPFPFTPQPANVPPTSPTALSYASASQHPGTLGFVNEAPQSPDVNIDDPLLPPSYDQPYSAGTSNLSQQQQQPNLFPGHARKN